MSHVDWDNIEPPKPINEKPKLVGQTKQGYNIYRKENGAGGHSYYTDEVGAMFYDTNLCDSETMRQILKLEDEFLNPPSPLIARISDLIKLLTKLEEEENLPIYVISNGNVYELPLDSLYSFVCPVGPCKASINGALRYIPKHLIVKCP